MKMSDSWARSQIGQNAIVKGAHTNVVSRFGSGAPVRGRMRKKFREEMIFKVGQSEIGGEDEI